MVLVTGLASQEEQLSLSLLALGPDVMHPDVMHQWDPIHSAGYFGYSGHVGYVLWLQYIYGVK